MKPAFFFLIATVLAGAAAAPPAEAPETIVECDGASEMVSSNTETIATFHDHVVVTGTNIKMYCDVLKVVATRKGDPKATIGKYGNFKSLIATGHVRIFQGNRVATCGRAEVFPGEDRIVLSDHPDVRDPDDNYEASGYRMVLYRGQRRAVIEAEPGARTRITLPPVKNMGLDEPAAATTPGAGAPPSEQPR